MDLGSRLADLQERVVAYREMLLTEEAAKTALVLPFLGALGYDIFDPTEIVPEYVADIGAKRGEKVDYAIRQQGRVVLLVECKPAAVALDPTHAGQLSRYFSVTEARLAILTNGIDYQFFADLDQRNRMDDRPFFSFSLAALRPHDIRTIEKFAKPLLNVHRILAEAAQMKLQTQVRHAVERELAEPSPELVSLIARRVHPGKLTPSLRQHYAPIVGATVAAVVRDRVTQRLSSALGAAPAGDPFLALQAPALAGPSDDELWGFRIVQAIAARIVDPRRVVLREAKRYCAVLLDDNNRRTLARLHFRGRGARHVGTLVGQDETRVEIADLTDIFRLADRIETRVLEFEHLPVGAQRSAGSARPSRSIAPSIVASTLAKQRRMMLVTGSSA